MYTIGLDKGGYPVNIFGLKKVPKLVLWYSLYGGANNLSILPVVDLHAYFAH